MPDEIYSHPTLMTNLELANTYFSEQDNGAGKVLKIFDHSGNGRHSAAGRNLALVSPGKVENCYAEFLQIHNRNYTAVGYKGVTGNDPRSVSFWINTNAISAGSSNAIILYWGDVGGGGAGQTWQVEVNDNAGKGNIGAPRVSVFGGYATATTSVNDGVWHHVVVRYNGTKTDHVEFIIDGVSDAHSGMASQAINTAALDDVEVGARLNAFDLDGNLEQVLIYSKYLSNAEVADLYNSGNGLEFYPECTSDPVHCYWDFDGDADYLELTQANGADDFEADNVTNNEMSFATLIEFNRVPTLSGAGWGEPHTDCVIVRQGRDINGVEPEGYNLYLDGGGGGTSLMMLMYIGYRRGGAPFSQPVQCDPFGAWPSGYLPLNTKLLLGFTSEWTGVNTLTFTVYLVTPIAATQIWSTNIGTLGLPISFPNSDSFWLFGDSQGYDSDVKVYWTNFKDGTIWTQADFEDMFDRTWSNASGKDPNSDFNPMFYQNYEDAVAAALNATVGGYTFDVNGDPVQSCCPGPGPGPGPTPVPTTNFIAEILIGDEVIWSARNSVPQQEMIFNVQKYAGTQRLRFRIRGVE